MSAAMHDRERLLAGLLGPAVAELTCDACFDALDVYVDLEIAGESGDRGVPEMRAHLAGCPACQEDYESLRAFVTSQGGGIR